MNKLVPKAPLQRLHKTHRVWVTVPAIPERRIVILDEVTDPVTGEVRGPMLGWRRTFVAGEQPSTIVVPWKVS